MGINFLDRGYNDTPAVLPGDFPKLPAGGYVCYVFSADISNSKSGNPMLVLFLDIAEGAFTHHFKDAANRVKSFDLSKQWDSSAIYRQLLFDKDGKVSRFFKGLLSCFQLSNPNLKLNLQNFEPNSLQGSLIGFVFAEEEYSKRDGSIASRIFPKFPKSIADIHNNNFSLPPIKKISPNATKSATDSDDFFSGNAIDPTDVPF